MPAHCPSTRLALGIVIACSILCAPCSAQESVPDVDAAGCQNLPMFPKLAASVVVSCHREESVEVKMPLTPDAQGFAREKSVRGTYEFREYQIVRADQRERAFENLMQWAPMAGFIVKYSVSPSTITARNGDTWLLINVNDEFYDVTAVQAKEEPWTPVKDAEGISREVQSKTRVGIYGIEFSPDNLNINEDTSKILFQVLKYLTVNPQLNVVVESHKFSPRGNPEDDMEITRKRVKTMIAWLVAHGINAGRLQSRALGRTMPVTENDTAIEVQRNERIVLATAAP